jgi:hypothetical protein
MDLSVVHTVEGRRKRADSTRRVPEITFVLYLCGAIRTRASLEEIAEQAMITYPRSYVTVVARKRIPDLALMLLTLNEGKKREWGFVAGCQLGLPQPGATNRVLKKDFQCHCEALSAEAISLFGMGSRLEIASLRSQ